MKIKIFFVLIWVLFAQQPPKENQPAAITIDSQPINQIQQQRKQNLQQIVQIDQEAKLIEELNDNLPTWIKQELQEASTVLELPITQTFSFVVQSQNEIIFKWDPSKNKELKLIVNVFYIGSQGDLIVIQDAEEFQYVQVLAKNPNQGIFILVGKVYRSKILTVDFNTDYKHLKFVNKNSEKVLIEIDIQMLEFVVEKGVPDDSFTTIRQKLHSIILQSQSTEIQREHIYKWQWGYLQHERSHQIQILGFTGIQLIAIITTAILQMYFLKGLLDNRAVV